MEGEQRDSSHLTSPFGFLEGYVCACVSLSHVGTHSPPATNPPHSLPLLLWDLCTPVPWGAGGLPVMGPLVKQVESGG